MKKILLLAMFGIFSLTAPAQSMQFLRNFPEQCPKQYRSGCIYPYWEIYPVWRYEKLSAWFADNLELNIMGAINNCTRNQARLIIKNFSQTILQEVYHYSQRAVRLL